MANTIKEIASNYIFGLMTACTEADKSSLEYHDAKAALEDLDGIISAVGNMTSASIETIAHYCTMYQQEALELI